MIRHIAAALTVLALGAGPLAAQDDAPVDIAGDWATSQGPMQIEQLPNGAYRLSFDAIPGVVIGTLEGNRMVGAWTRQDGPSPCAAPKDGSLHWGRFGMQFDPRDGFAALWTYCDAEPRAVNFTGIRAPRP